MWDIFTIKIIFSGFVTFCRMSKRRCRRTTPWCSASQNKLFRQHFFRQKNPIKTIWFETVKKKNKRIFFLDTKEKTINYCQDRLIFTSLVCKVFVECYKSMIQILTYFNIICKFKKSPELTKTTYFWISGQLQYMIVLEFA